MRRPGWPTVFFNPGWIGLSHPYVPYKVVGDDLDGPPGGVGGEAARGEMVEAHAVLEVSDGILDLGVAAVVGLQFQSVPVPVGDEAVTGVAGEAGQLGTGRGLHSADAAPHRRGVGLTRSNWRAWPHQKLRKNVPRVDGALTTPSSTRPVSPARSALASSISASSMQSPPISAAATNVSIWSPTFARPGASPGSTWLSTSSPSPKRPASVTGSSSPALATSR